MRLAVVALGALGALAIAPAAARADLPAERGIDYQLVEPEVGGAPRNVNGPDTLFLNRCVGGCAVSAGSNNARTDTSSIPDDDATLNEFQYSDEIWDAVVACVADTYRPYGVEIVTEEPGAGDYVEVMVAGSPGELGQGNDVLGIAPMATDCSPQVNWIAFAFANVHGTDPVLDLCATAAHEAGHIYGLDHEFDCKDPMTYLTGCGQKYFLNVPVECGEFEGPRTCRCTGATQNSHVKLSSNLGVGELPPPPTVMIPYPVAGAAVGDGFSMFAEIEESRILTRVEFWLNGHPWHVVDGRRDLTTYSYQADAELPDGVIDLEIRAYNDLEVEGSASVTVTKGEPCTSADTCLDGQSCNTGRCAWPEPTGVLGQTCERDADCISRLCEFDGNVSLCSDLCLLGIDGSCADGYSCLDAGDRGLCWPADLTDPGGCCSTSGGSPAVPATLTALFLAALLRRRR